MTKAELRKSYKSKRVALTHNQIEDLSVAIANQILQLQIWDKEYYHVFLPIVNQKEINTEYLLHVLQGKDKHCIISKSDFKAFKMTNFLLQDNTKIVVNSYGIPEPVNGIEIDNSKIEVVFIPLLAYDIKGNRVGYGKGFYDRFLSECNPNCIKIGLSFYKPEEDIKGVLKTDIKLDYCVTPNAIFEF
ncbi:5-formyltetrahydrofolate cyclo-ligase [Aurantibacter sp.]|uniref:5-formyltetrahydrofolate cyclo-ligase n=1 Tax=Aurantibacter sp. TaxID=2807103 RepID=UPI0035C82DE7